MIVWVVRLYDAHDERCSIHATEEAAKASVPDLEWRVPKEAETAPLLRSTDHVERLTQWIAEKDGLEYRLACYEVR